MGKGDLVPGEKVKKLRCMGGLRYAVSRVQVCQDQRGSLYRIKELMQRD